MIQGIVSRNSEWSEESPRKFNLLVNQYNQRPRIMVRSFAVECDRPGRPRGLVQVELRGEGFEGSVRDGDIVRVEGSPRDGQILRPLAVFNLTTRSVMRARRTTQSSGTSLIGAILLLFLVLAFLAHLGGGPGVRPWPPLPPPVVGPPLHPPLPVTFGP